MSFLTCFTRGLWLPPFQQFDCSVRCCHHVWFVQLFYAAQRISTDYGIGLIPLIISFKMCAGEIMISQCLLTLRAPFSCPYIPQQVAFMLTLVLLMVMALTGYNVLFSVLILMPFIPKCPSSCCEGVWSCSSEPSWLCFQILAGVGSPAQAPESFCGDALLLGEGCGPFCTPRCPAWPPAAVPEGHWPPGGPVSHLPAPNGYPG